MKQPFEIKAIGKVQKAGDGFAIQLEKPANPTSQRNA
jgi:hypothetical protein